MKQNKADKADDSNSKQRVDAVSGQLRGRSGWRPEHRLCPIMLQLALSMHFPD